LLEHARLLFRRTVDEQLPPRMPDRLPPNTVLLKSRMSVESQ